jgi:hypothetical protein
MAYFFPSLILPPINVGVILRNAASKIEHKKEKNSATKRYSNKILIIV